MSGCKEQGKAGNTVNSELAHLSSLFSFAHRLGLTSKNPCKGVPKLKANKRDRFLSHEEIGRLLAACEGDLRDMALLALSTGMRASEVMTLTREQVDLKRGLAILLDTKNGDSRSLPLSAEALELFARRAIPLKEFFPSWNL